MTKSSIKQQFEALYAARHEALYAFVWKRTGNAHLAEEVVQNTFIRWWELAASDRTGSMKAEKAIFLIAKGMLVDEHRKQLASNRLAEAYLEQIPQEADNGHRLSLEDLQKIIRTAIDQLPERRRQIFNMSRFEELTYQEIADQLELSVNTVESQMVKAIRELRGKIYPHMNGKWKTAHLFVLLSLGLY